MKKILILIIAFTFIVSVGFYAVPVKALAATSIRVYKVTASSLNFRSSPRISSSNRIGSLRRGQVVQLVSKYNSTWWKVRRSDGRVGYVHRGYLKYVKTITIGGTTAPTPTPQTNQGTYINVMIYKVRVTALNFRKTPKIARSNRIRVLRRNELVELISKYNSTWWKIRDKYNKSGYVSKRYLTYVRTEKRLIATAEPTIPPTATPDVSNPPEETPAATPAASLTVNLYRVDVKVSSTLNFRSSPRISTNKIGSLFRGEVVELVSKYNSRWWKVKRSKNNTVGYVDHSYLVFIGTRIKIEGNEIAPSIVDMSKQKYTYDEMLGDIDELNTVYPGKFTVESIGTTPLGNDLPVIILGNPDAENAVLIQASMHAREYVTTVMSMAQVEFLLANYNTLSYGGRTIEEILNSVTFYIVPMINPDGVKLSQNGLSIIDNPDLKASLITMNGGSSTFTRWKANIRGVNLNRNFDALWDTVDDGVSYPHSSLYKGTGPESEPESKALADFTRAHPKIEATISYHSTGSIIYWWYYQTGEFLEKSEEMAKRAETLTGYRLVSKSTSMKTNAGYKDYCILKLGIPGLTVELGTTTAPNSQSEYSRIWSQNKYLILDMADFAITH